MPRNYKKRNFAEIRNKIIESLKNYPKGTYEISKDIHCAFQTAKKHLLYLESLNVVKKAEYTKRELWVLIK